MYSPASFRITRRWLPGTITSDPWSSVRRPRRSNTSRIMRRSSGTVSLTVSSPPVTPASAMKDPISMWSGAIVWLAPRRLLVPWTVITFEPIPSMAAPIDTSIRARSWTCGSEAALRMTVGPRVSAAAMSAFSVAITDGSSIRKSHGRSPSGASSRMSLPCLTVAPSARRASRWGSSRRRPITSPPGGGIEARPKRASSGPATRNEARIRSARSASTSAHASTPEQSTETSPGRSHWTLAPRPSSSSSSASTSRILGTFRRITSSSVSRQAARIGRAPFLFPAGRIVPESGAPPWITNFSMSPRRLARDPSCCGCATAAEDESRSIASTPLRRRTAGDRGRVPSGSVTAMSTNFSRPEAWTLLSEWVSSPSLLRHALAVEAAMRAYAPRFDGDVELWGMTGLLHDLDYERHPNLGDGHPRYALKELEERGYPPELIRAVASHADFMGVPRETPMEKALFAVDELCGFILACAYVRPEGLLGMTPKSVKKKLKQPSFAAAVNREDLLRGAAELGVDFDEHVATVIAALGAR